MDKLRNCLPNDRPPQFQLLDSTIEHFRALRHQFAHRSTQMFSFAATTKTDPFEIFLQKQKGISFRGSYWCSRENGEAGVAIPYQISSDKFLFDFYSESCFYYSMILDMLFPTDEKSDSVM